MSPKELLETALRVLVACNHGRTPASADLAILKEVFSLSANLADDELACQVIHDLSARAFRKPTQPETAPPLIDEVA
jgi:hypothetical protein